MSRTPYQAALACKGCGRDMGTFRVPKCHARASRAGVADLLIRQERDAAVCERCRGLDRAAHKAARLDAERKARAHTLGAKYNAEHEHARRRGYLVEVLALTAEQLAPRARQLRLFEAEA